MTRAAICAECEHFKFRGADGMPYPQIEHGIGRCAGYDGHATPVEPFVRWNAPHCVLFGKAPDMAKRLQFVEMRKRKEGGDVAAACGAGSGGANGSAELHRHQPIENKSTTRL